MKPLLAVILSVLIVCYVYVIATDNPKWDGVATHFHYFTGTTDCSKSGPNKYNASQFIITDFAGLDYMGDGNHWEHDFFICPGDYTEYGIVDISSVGPENLPYTLQWLDGNDNCVGRYADDEGAHPVRQPIECQAIVAGIVFDGAANWEVRGLTVIDETPQARPFKNSHHITLDRNYYIYEGGSDGWHIFPQDTSHDLIMANSATIIGEF